MRRLKLFFISSALLVCMSAFIWTSCDKDSDGKITEPVIVEPETPDRTVLLYIIGDNSLSSYASRNIDSIVSGMSKTTTTLQMLVYQDSKETAPTSWKIEKDKQGVARKNALKIYPEEQNSADPEVMSEIIREVFALSGTREKGLILWSHGSGWLPSPAFNPDRIGTLSFGPDMDSYLELWDIRKVLEKTGLHFDFIGFDACLMSGVEVAYELKDQTDYLIASPTEIMGIGFPYQTIVPVLGRTALDLPAMCDAYMQFFNGSVGKDGTISLINTAYLDDLAACYAQILKQTTLPDALNGKTIQQMGRRIPYTSADHTNIFYDMGDIVTNLSTPLYSQFNTILNQAVVYKNNTPRFVTFDIRSNSGLTVFIPELNPDHQYQSAYSFLQWYQATR